MQLAAGATEIAPHARGYYKRLATDSGVRPVYLQEEVEGQSYAPLRYMMHDEGSQAWIVSWGDRARWEVELEAKDFAYGASCPADATSAPQWLVRGEVKPILVTCEPLRALSAPPPPPPWAACAKLEVGVGEGAAKKPRGIYSLGFLSGSYSRVELESADGSPIYWNEAASTYLTWGNATEKWVITSTLGGNKFMDYSDLGRGDLGITMESNDLIRKRCPSKVRRWALGIVDIYDIDLKASEDLIMRCVDILSAEPRGGAGRRGVADERRRRSRDGDEDRDDHRRCATRAGQGQRAGQEEPDASTLWDALSELIVALENSC